MDLFINSKLEEARKIFGIEDFPGELFSFIISQDDYIDKYNLVILKEDLDKLSGFISYEEEYAYIGINYKRPIGHQNLTLAHELGHKFLDHGKSYFDNERTICSGSSAENAAFTFGSELLYPNTLFEQDYITAERDKLFLKGNEKALCGYINTLCHKYFMSFDAILRKFLFKRRIYGTDVKKYKKSLNNKFKKGYTELDANFHISNGSTYSVPSGEQFIYLKSLIEKAVEQEDVSKATAESLLLSYGLLEAEDI